MNEIKLNMSNLSNEERKQLTALIEKANKSKSKVWKPEENKVYYYISWCGEIGFSVNSTHLDDTCYEIGNAFQTKEEAEEEITRRKIIAKWKRLSIEAGEDDNEWDTDNIHWYCYYSHAFKKPECAYCQNVKDSSVFFPTRESLIEAISIIGEDNVKKYILGIKE